jgi:hypothetical protein
MRFARTTVGSLQERRNLAGGYLNSHVAELVETIRRLENELELELLGRRRHVLVPVVEPSDAVRSVGLRAALPETLHSGVAASHRLLGHRTATASP